MNSLSFPSTGTAYIHGMKHATGNFIIIMDADLSHHVSRDHFIWVANLRLFVVSLHHSVNNGGFSVSLGLLLLVCMKSDFGGMVLLFLPFFFFPFQPKFIPEFIQ